MQVWLGLLFVLHVAEGCTLEDHQQRKEITAYTGESVLLPCYCTVLQSRPETFTWNKLNRHEEISRESGQYRNRVQLGNDHSPGNLSLLISHLTEEDGGLYRCKVDGGRFTDISLTVKGCTLTDRGQILYITAHRGGSVLLPCSCTELRAKPGNVTWTKDSQNSQNWERISRESGQYRNRVQLFNDHSPGNLSLLISHLTEEDEGYYRCDGVKSEYTAIKLTVKGALVPGSSLKPEAVTPTPSPKLHATIYLKTSAEPSNTISSQKEAPTFDMKSSAELSTTTSSQKEPPESLPFIPFALVTWIFLHIVVAVVYCTKRTKVPDAATVYYINDDEDGAVSLQQRGKPAGVYIPPTDHTPDLEV